MYNQVELMGRPASDGIFAGPVVYLSAVNSKRQNSGSSKTEAFVLRSALKTAIEEVSHLSARSSEDANRILSFQLEMMGDPALSDDAFQKIDQGIAADIAWLDCISLQIANYDCDDDEYFRARASDLKDIQGRVLRHISGNDQDVHVEGAVYFGDDIAPTFFLESDWSQGGAVVLTGGSPLSHVAMLARACGVPMVVGLSGNLNGQHSHAIVDGGKGAVVFDATHAIRKTYAMRMGTLDDRRGKQMEFINKPAARKDGSRVELLINISSTEEIEQLDPACCDGIGLVRSEFLFNQGTGFPDEGQQVEAYSKLVNWAAGRPVTIRTLDLGGDKIVKGFTPENEKNPFLGLRGIRLALAHREVFRTQLRALARVAAVAPLSVMLPMVSDPREVTATRELLDLCLKELASEGIRCAKPLLGIMIEVPAAAIAPELFFDVDFFSIGSNDLMQYVTATARDNTSYLHAHDAIHPAVLKLMTGLVEFGNKHKIPVSICGDVASDERHLGELLNCGLKTLSVVPSRIARIKSALKEH
jgi:phosphoenolpyruvate-protein phosphotransferase (PTS system enzyme I)